MTKINIFAKLCIAIYFILKCVFSHAQAHETHSHNNYNQSSHSHTQNTQSPRAYENWSELDIRADYDSYTKRLNFTAELDRLSTAAERQTNNRRNIIEFTIDWRTYSRYFEYSSSTGKIFANVSQSLLSASSLDSSYRVGIKIFENWRQVHSSVQTIKPSKDFYRTLRERQNHYSNTQYTNSHHINNNFSSRSYSPSTFHSNSWYQKQNSNYSSSVQSSSRSSNIAPFDNPVSEWEVLAYRYIFRIEAQTHDRNERIATLSKFIHVLESVRYTHNNPTVIDSMIITMKNRIISYYSL